MSLASGPHFWGHIGGHDKDVDLELFHLRPMLLPQELCEKDLHPLSMQRQSCKLLGPHQVDLLI